MSIHTDDELVARFVETFCKLDGGCWGTHKKPPPEELNAGVDSDDWELVMWRPAPIKVEADELQLFYHRLPLKLPPLYERLIMSWRWLEVFSYRIRLLANPPGAGLAGLAENILQDPAFEQHLIANGFVPFGFYSGENSDLHVYDPVCFDTNHRHADGDCPIRAFVHEAMLSFDHIRESWVVWPSFRDLMLETIEAANRQ